MITLLITYKYLLIIPLAIIEGPIVSVICGFLITLGFFNPFIIFIIMIVGDIIGDGMYYYIGYSGGKLLRYFKISEAKIEKAKKYFHENHHKAIILSKLIHGVGFTGLVAAGVLHMPYKRFFKACIIVSIIQSIVMLTIGIAFGHAYTIVGKLLNFYSAIASVLALAAAILAIFQNYKKRINKEIEI